MRNISARCAEVLGNLNQRNITLVHRTCVQECVISCAHTGQRDLFDLLGWQWWEKRKKILTLRRRTMHSTEQPPLEIRLHHHIRYQIKARASPRLLILILNLIIPFPV